MKSFPDIHQSFKLPVFIWAPLLAMVAALLAWRPIRANDAFWHMMLGRAVLEHGSRTVPEPTAMDAFVQARVVPEWLWGVATYLLNDLAGPTALTLLTMLLAFLSVFALVHMLGNIAPKGATAAVVFTSALVLIAFIHWFHLRPQSAFLMLLPSFLWGTQKHLAAPENKRLIVFLVVLQILWAQLHGSFVLGPTLFLLLAGPQLLRGPSERTQFLVVFLLLLAGCLTSAHGIDIGAYILNHTGGYATSTILDMRAPTWSTFNPLGSARNTAYCLLWVLGAIGVLIAPRAPLRYVALALLGAALLATAVRFIAASAILLSPLALHGAVTVFSQQEKRTRVVAAAILVALLAWKGNEIHDYQGPLGESGFSEGGFPVISNRYLGTLDEGTAVFTSYFTGGPIGYWQHGHVKTYIDSRTPLHFDNTDMAMAQQAWRYDDALARSLRRYGATAAVVERNTIPCALFKNIWHPVVVEPRFTTFVPGGTESQTLIEPCGKSYLAPGACDDDSNRLEEEIVKLEALGQTPFTRFLRAARLIMCDGDLSRAEELIPDRHLAWYYRDQFDLLDAERLLRKNRSEQALDLLVDLAAKRNPYAAKRAMDAFREGEISSAEGRRVLERYIDAWVTGPGTATVIHANLALLCADLGDVECVRFHGLQAAVRGSQQGPLFLKWLRDNHPTARVREDAAAWLYTLASMETE